jgi:glycosyltransferase involved in cell wall biosynthesis
MGVPVLGSDCIGLREVLRGTPSRTVLAANADALASALAEAVGSPWREAARRFVPEARERFDVRPFAKTLAGLYESLEHWSKPC